jgi:Fic family protein
MMPPALGKTDPVLQRIRGEYLEMPGLRLTVKQACRFWSLDEQTCARLLEQLVAAGFLARIGQDGYELSDGTRRRPAGRGTAGLKKN